MAEKKPAGRIRKFVDKVRKKVVPTFGEQFDKARKEKKKTFRSTRDDTKKGKLEYSSNNQTRFFQLIPPSDKVNNLSISSR